MLHSIPVKKFLDLSAWIPYSNVKQISRRVERELWCLGSRTAVAVS
jgi:hypothetical protein